MNPIEDYYGSRLKAEAVMASSGPMVDLDWEGPEYSSRTGEVDGYFRLAPEDALKLADQLTAAAQYPQGASK